MVKTWHAILAGVISTLTMDLLSGIASRLGFMAPLSPNLLGRWFASVARAQPLHADIARSAPINHELLIALPVHYAIGLVLAAFYFWGTGRLGWPRSLGTALTFGLCTDVLPWLVMFPAMGFGFFGVHGPEGTRLFLSSLTSHTFFGLGIWIGIRAMNLA